MNNSSLWQYDEFQQVGTDYGSKTEVDIYDLSIQNFVTLKPKVYPIVA